MKKLLPILIAVLLPVSLWAFQARPGLFSTIQGTSTAATALKLAGGITAGSGSIGIVDTTGKIPALTSSFFASVSFSSANLTGTIPAGVTFSGAFGSPTGRIAAANLPVIVVASTSANTATGSVSVPDSTATTVFNTSGLAGLFIVEVHIADTSAIYTAYAHVVCDGTFCRITADNGAAMTLTLSGTNVQATQTSGGSATVAYSYLRIR